MAYFIFPLVGFFVMVGALLGWFSGWLMAVAALALVGAVVSAIHHAEVVAHRVGEPYGTLVLAVSITIIEVGLIVSLMLAGGVAKEGLARDTIFSALMIICNGVVGICLLVGALRHREQLYGIHGAASALTALFVLGVLILILPNFTTSAPGAAYSLNQLVFVAAASLIIWAAFVAIQTGRHRDYFLPADDPDNEDHHADPPTIKQAWVSFSLLAVSLVVVVGLAKGLSPNIESMVAAVGAPKAVVGVMIALLVLLPETGAAIRAARANRFQTSMNLALGSALASIGLTVPSVALAVILFGLPLQLGLGPKEAILLALTFVVSGVTFSTGRTNVLLAVVHLVLFTTFLFFTFVP